MGPALTSRHGKERSLLKCPLQARSMGKKLYFEQMHCSIQPCLPRPHPVLKCRAFHRMTGDRGQQDQTFLSSLPVDKGPGSIESKEDTYCSSKMAGIEYCSDAKPSSLFGTSCTAAGRKLTQRKSKAWPCIPSQNSNCYLHPPAFSTLAVSRPPPITCHNLPKHVPGLELELDVCCPETPNRVRVPLRIRRKTSTGQSTDSQPLAIRGVLRWRGIPQARAITRFAPHQPSHPSNPSTVMRPDQPPLPLRRTRIDARPAITEYFQSILRTTAHNRLPTYTTYHARSLPDGARRAFIIPIPPLCSSGFESMLLQTPTFAVHYTRPFFPLASVVAERDAAAWKTRQSIMIVLSDPERQITRASNTVSQHLSSDPRSSDAIRTEQHLDNGPLRPRHSITWTRRQRAARIMPVPPPLPLQCSTLSTFAQPELGYCEPARSTSNRESGISTWLPDRRIKLAHMTRIDGLRYAHIRYVDVCTKYGPSCLHRAVKFYPLTLLQFVPSSTPYTSLDPNRTREVSRNVSIASRFFYTCPTFSDISRLPVSKILRLSFQETVKKRSVVRKIWTKPASSQGPSDVVPALYPFKPARGCHCLSVGIVFDISVLAGLAIRHHQTNDRYIEGRKGLEARASGLPFSPQSTQFCLEAFSDIKMRGRDTYVKQELHHPTHLTLVTLHLYGCSVSSGKAENRAEVEGQWHRAELRRPGLPTAGTQLRLCCSRAGSSNSPLPPYARDHLTGRSMQARPGSIKIPSFLEAQVWSLLHAIQTKSGRVYFRGTPYPWPRTLFGLFRTPRLSWILKAPIVGREIPPQALAARWVSSSLHLLPPS
ncbi:uncharacterized protein CLUP02_05260 [Colletotrichum lupini]|uniref:Uncharacterized protein n=1 Tax=Colletotrichum lupini TaxID=145971 RepID=A0A9Q8SMT0_9PEZI|nr:uncharacterized protein CLUP02_05260 [Colletotrichum lupini]UQC79780.1 hypothetical protein CLUP02_05260 [Colletotrichum lupini]